MLPARAVRSRTALTCLTDLGELDCRPEEVRDVDETRRRHIISSQGLESAEYTAKIFSIACLQSLLHLNDKFKQFKKIQITWFGEWLINERNKSRSRISCISESRMNSVSSADRMLLSSCCRSAFTLNSNGKGSTTKKNNKACAMRSNTPVVNQAE